MGYEYVLAVDPGGTTGWAIHGRGIAGHGQESFDQFVATAGHMFDPAFSPFTEHEMSAVVCERYTITAETLRKSRQTTALEVIGFLRGMCVLYGVRFVLQSPGDAKRFATDDRLRSVGWYEPGQGHANDAARHLMLYLVKTGQMAAPLL